MTESQKIKKIVGSRIIASDLHLTSAPDEAYRHKIFDYLFDAAKEHNVEYIDILGDLTEFKDKHSSDLVNIITDGIIKLASVAKVRILKGNHDYTDSDSPFFNFLGGFENVEFFKNPTKSGHDLFVPHSHNVAEDWKDLDFEGITCVYFHQAVEGV